MADFLHLIYQWYNVNRRELPWRKTTDPYKIWISEIILQQTRVEQGLEYYLKFTERFPDCNTLASANEDLVLKLWQGLGYYSRARNLHATAKIISNNYNGVFPQTYSEILSLKGIGPYTAAAVASIAFGLPYPVLDGNVYRFLSRYFGIKARVDSAAGKKEFLKVACEIMNPVKPGFHNQALMEFGALQCTPQAPDCENCPLSASCYAFSRKATEQFPVKTKKTVKRNRYFYFYLIENNNSIWLEKRTRKDIWKNLYQFPVIETPNELNTQEVAGLHPPVLNGERYTLISISSPHKHVLSHQNLFARLIHIRVEDSPFLNEHYFKIKKKNIHKYPVPRLIEKLAETSNFLKF